jgi:benzylsuccinate CoA-transferase BbsF subunit
MSAQILKGIRVIELGLYAALPLTGRILASLGAEVIKIETNKALDTQYTAPVWSPGAAQPNFQLGKLRITLDIRSSEGREIFMKLLKKSDIFMTNFRRGTLARWGIDFPDIKVAHPKIIILSQQAMGSRGPYNSYKVYGAMVQNMCGISLMTGFSGPDMATANTFYSDYHAAIFQVLFLLAALIQRRRKGSGWSVETSIFTSGVCTIGPAILDYQVNGRLPQRIGNKDVFASPHGIYPCQGEDIWCAIAVFSAKEWMALCNVIGNPPWTKDPKFETLLGRIKNADDLDARLAEWTASHRAEEVMVEMQKAGIAAGIVSRGKDLADNIHLKERKFYKKTKYYVTDLKKPGADWEVGTRIPVASIPINLTETPCKFGSFKRIGEDNNYVYGKLLHMSSEEIERLKATGVLV